VNSKINITLLRDCNFDFCEDLSFLGKHINNPFDTAPYAETDLFLFILLSKEMKDNKNNMTSLKLQMKEKLCFICQFRSNFFNWCNDCKFKHFKLNYDDAPSGNDEIDRFFLKDYYCESKFPDELIEWIPYNEFKDITHIAANKETFNAIWSKGCICDWDEDKFNWSRKVKKVALVNFKYDLIDFYMVSYSDPVFYNFICN
jgi:hypothetical protein